MAAFQKTKTMSPYFRYFQKCFFTLICVGFLLLAVGCSDATPVMPGGLYATPGICDLGIVVDADTITGEFKIVNTTHKTVNVREIKLSCGCADLRLSKESIPANGFVDAKLVVTLEGKYGPTVFEAMVFTNDATVPIIPLRLSANIAAKKLDGTIILNLGLLSPEANINQSFTTLPGKVKAIAVEGVRYSPSFPATPKFDISAVPTPNQDVRLNIKGVAPPQNGEFSIDLNLVGDGADWGKAHILLQGIVRPEISIPPAVSMGFIEPSQSNKTVVRVTGVADFLSKNTIDKMIVTSSLSKNLSVRFINAPSVQLEFALQHSGNAGSFFEVVELEFTLSSGKKVQLSTNVSARFL
jgi:hypothetical protein